MSTRPFDWSAPPTELDLDQLERRARKATAGPWRAGQVANEHAVWAHDPNALGQERLLLRMNEHFENVDDRVYLASLPPEIALELIARARRGGTKQPLVVRTARVASDRGDRLDITRKSGREGLFLAPSWELLNPVLVARKALDAARAARTDADELARATLGFVEAWDAYVVGYRDQMRASYRSHRDAWDALLARSSVTLVCYCTDHLHCHRTLLATQILPALGAHYAGEVEARTNRKTKQ